jgi:3-dehydroquinate dehydratase
MRVEFGSVAQLDFFQSNHEGALIDKIGALAEAKFDGLVINGAALTHTSVALHDALLGAIYPLSRSTSRISTNGRNSATPHSLPQHALP